MPDIKALLNNGSREWYAAVLITYKVLIALAERSEMIILRKLRDGCENPTEPVLLSPEEKGLIITIDNGEYIVEVDGTMRESVRNVILSAIETNGECYILHNPIKNPLSEFWFL